MPNVRYYWDRNFYTWFGKVAAERLGALAAVLLTKQGCLAGTTQRPGRLSLLLALPKRPVEAA